MVFCKCCGRGDSDSDDKGAVHNSYNSRNAGNHVDVTSTNNCDVENMQHRLTVSKEDSEDKVPVKSLKTWVQDFSEHTTMHGLSHIMSGNCCTAVFWAVIMVLMLSVGIYQVQELVSNFISSPTLTSINVLYPHGLQFPELTICLLSKINRTRLKESYPFMLRDVAEFSTASFISAYGTALLDLGYFAMQNRTVESLQNELERQFRGNDTIKEFFEDVTFTCQGQFLTCWFENGDMFDCCDPAQKLKIKRFLLHSGPCYKFHFDDSLVQRLPGPVGGFGFVYWYPNNDIVNSVFNAYDEHGVHMYTAPSNAMLEKNPVAMPVGSHVHITLSATKSTRLKKDALGRQVCFEKELKYFDIYDYPACQAECLIDNMLDICNCTGLTTFAKLPDGVYCTPQQAFECFSTHAMNFSYLLTKCRLEKCMEACEYWTYRPSITVGKVFNPTLQQKMVDYWRLPNNSDPSQSLIIADVYFDDIQYMEINQVNALTVEGFISQIGGAMGLWTGASIITWIHLMFYCSAYCCMTKKKKKERRRQERLTHQKKRWLLNLFRVNQGASGREHLAERQNDFRANNPDREVSSSDETQNSETLSKKQRKRQRKREKRIMESRRNAEMRFLVKRSTL